MTSPGNTRKPVLLAGFLAGVSLLLLITLIAYSARRPLEGSQINNVLQAKFIAKEGRHYYRLNETVPVVYANFHPPLYINFLAAAFVIGGVSDLSARGANLFLVLGVMALMVGVAVRTSGDRDRGLKTGLLAVALYAVNPAVIQSVLTTDPDGTILNLMIILTVYLLVCDFGGRWFWKVLAMGAGFALCFWSKQTTPLLFAPLLLAHAWISRGRYLTVPRLLAAIGLGLVGFGLSYAAYSWWTGLPVDHVWEYSRSMTLRPALDLTTGRNLLRDLKLDFVWLNPFLIVGALVASDVWSRGRRAWRTLPVVDVVGIGLYCAYFIIMMSQGPGLPRYKVPSLAFLSLILSRWMVTYWESPADGRRLPRSAGLLLTSFVLVETLLGFYYLLAFPDLAVSTLGISEPVGRGEWWAAGEYLRGPVLFVAPALAVWWAFGRFRRLGWREAFLCAAALLVWPSQAAEAVKHAAADYSTYIKSGRKGMREVLTYLKREENQGAKILYNGEPDLAFYVDNEIYPLRVGDYGLPIPQIYAPNEEWERKFKGVVDRVMRSPTVILIVDTKYISSRTFWYAAARSEFLGRPFSSFVRIGDFEVYRRVNPESFGTRR